MKNFLLYIVFFLVSSYIFGQEINGKVIFSTFQNSDSFNNELSNLQFKKLNDTFNEAAKKLSFELTFNQTKSSFSLIKNLYLEKDMDTKMAILILRGNNVFYSDSQKKQLIEKKEFLNEPFLVSSNFNEFDWKLLNEIKKIDRYQCLKAIGYKVYQDRNLELQKKEIVVWYSPDLPFPFGPFEAIGLPGLVLEYTIGDFTFSAQKIDLNIPEIEISKPIKGTQITNEAFFQLISDKAVEFKN